MLIQRDQRDRKQASIGLRAVAVLASVSIFLIAGCVTETHRALTPETVATHAVPYSGPKYTIVVGKFNNRSTYMQGIFSDGLDRLGNQARTILETHLQQTGRFTVVNRSNMDGIRRTIDGCAHSIDIIDRSTYTAHIASIVNSFAC